MHPLWSSRVWQRSEALRTLACPAPTDVVPQHRVSTAQHSTARTRATSASAGLCWLAACSTSAAMRATAVSPAAAVVRTRSTPEPQLSVPARTVLPGPRSTGADSPAQQGGMGWVRRDGTDC